MISRPPSHRRQRRVHARGCQPPAGPSHGCHPRAVSKSAPKVAPAPASRAACRPPLPRSHVRRRAWCRPRAAERVDRAERGRPGRARRLRPIRPRDPRLLGALLSPPFARPGARSASIAGHRGVLAGDHVDQAVVHVTSRSSAGDRPPGCDQVASAGSSASTPSKTAAPQGRTGGRGRGQTVPGAAPAKKRVARRGQRPAAIGPRRSAISGR